MLRTAVIATLVLAVGSCSKDKVAGEDKAAPAADDKTPAAAADDKPPAAAGKIEKRTIKRSELGGKAATEPAPKRDPSKVLAPGTEFKAVRTHSAEVVAKGIKDEDLKDGDYLIIKQDPDGNNCGIFVQEAATNTGYVACGGKIMEGPLVSEARLNEWVAIWAKEENLRHEIVMKGIKAMPSGRFGGTTRVDYYDENGQFVGSQFE